MKSHSIDGVLTDILKFSVWKAWGQWRCINRNNILREQKTKPSVVRGKLKQEANYGVNSAFKGIFFGFVRVIYNWRLRCWAQRWQMKILTPTVVNLTLMLPFRMQSRNVHIRFVHVQHRRSFFEALISLRCLFSLWINCTLYLIIKGLKAKTCLKWELSKMVSALFGLIDRNTQIAAGNPLLLCLFFFTETCPLISSSHNPGLRLLCHSLRAPPLSLRHLSGILDKSRPHGTPKKRGNSTNTAERLRQVSFIEPWTETFFPFI